MQGRLLKSRWRNYESNFRKVAFGKLLSENDYLENKYKKVNSQKVCFKKMFQKETAEMEGADWKRAWIKKWLLPTGQLLYW